LIVAATNLIAYLLVPSSFTPQAEAVFEKDAQWAAPMLWRSEFRNVLWMSVRRGELTLDAALQTMEDAVALLNGREYDVASGPVLELAVAAVKSPYDCEFVSLAQDLGVPLVTGDLKVIAAFPHTAVSPSVFVDSR
jgi:predicted nucleic acid-binding protein